SPASFSPGMEPVAPVWAKAEPATTRDKADARTASLAESLRRIGVSALLLIRPVCGGIDAHANPVLEYHDLAALLHRHRIGGDARTGPADIDGLLRLHIAFVDVEEGRFQLHDHSVGSGN